MRMFRSLLALALLVGCSGSRFQSDGSGGGAGGVAGTAMGGSGAQATGGAAGSGGASGGAAGATGGSGGAAGAGATGGAAGAAGACATNLKGAQLVKIESGDGFFCIDKTEVTAAQYQNFLAAGTKPQQPAYCAFNTDFTPTHGWPASNVKLPVVGVDWCDAWAFCKWAGKRLCGKIGGGSSAPGDVSNVSDQWYYTCSRAGSQQYPYGNSYSATACNGGDGAAQALMPAPSSQTCQGGYSGVYDMSGNVSEWVDDCEGYNGPDDNCQDRSGSFMTDSSTQVCGYAFSDKRSETFGDVGFRCCWEPG